MTTIWADSGLVNAVIFVVVDVIALWAISDGLLALQTYYSHKLDQDGRKERTGQSTKWTFPFYIHVSSVRVPLYSLVLFILNVGAVIMAFIGTLGVSGDRFPRWDHVHLTNVTTLFAKPFSANFSATDGLTYGEAGAVCLSCSVRNETHVGFWPVAHNMSKDGKATMGECQNGAGGVEPLIMVECFSMGSKPCFITDMFPKLWFNATIDLNSSKRWSPYVSEFRFFESVSRTRIFSNKNGRAVVIRKNANIDFPARTVIFVEVPNEPYSYFGLGYSSVSSSLAQFALKRPVQLHPKSLIKNDSNVLGALRFGFTFDELQSTQNIMPRLIEDILDRALATAPSSIPAYKKTMRTATTISPLAVMLFVGIMVLAGVLSLIKITVYISVRRSRNKTGNAGDDIDVHSPALSRWKEMQIGMSPESDFMLPMSLPEPNFKLDVSHSSFSSNDV